MGTITEGDEVIVRREGTLSLFTVKLKKFFWLDKMKFCFDGAVAHPYGSQFILEGSNLVKTSKTDDDSTGEEGGSDVMGDNRHLQDAGEENQKLSAEDIDSMRKEGISGQEIVGRLVENSETFDSKTDFSKEKYLTRKKKKHVPVVTVLKPTFRLMFDYHSRRSRNKLCWLREDTFAQMLCQANVRAGANYMVVEGIDGLLTAAVLDRLGGFGKIVELFSGTQPNRLNGLGWSRQYYNEHVLSISTSKVKDLIDTLARTASVMIKIDPPTSAVEDGQDSDSSAAAGQSVTSSVLAQPAMRFTDFSHAAESDTKPRHRCTPCDPGCYSKKHKHDDDENAAGDKCSCDQTVAADTTVAASGESSKRKVEVPAGSEESSFKKERFDLTKLFLKDHKMDGLLVATKSYPLPLVLDLLEFVAPSRQVVIYCPYQEPLIMCYKAMRSYGQDGGLINMNITETWLRDYQVLPNRTHPVINMNGSSGYLLTATTVERS